MTNEDPFLEVTFDASHLDFQDVYVLVLVQFFYWEPGTPGKFFARSFQLSKFRTAYTLKSRNVRRSLTAYYMYFAVYVFQPKHFSRAAFTTAGAVEEGSDVVGSAVDMSTSWDDIAVDCLADVCSMAKSAAELEDALGKLLMNCYLSPFRVTNAANVIIGDPQATGKLQLTFFPNGEMDGESVTATQATAVISYLNTSNQLVKLIEQLSGKASLGIPTKFILDAENRHRLVEVFKDDLNFTLEVELIFDIDKNDGTNTQEKGGPFTVSPLLPGITLKPGITLYSLEYQPRHIQWISSDDGAAIQLVLVIVTLNESIEVSDDRDPVQVQHYSFPTVAMSPFHTGAVYRTIMTNTDFTVTYEWVAYYYFSDGQVTMIGNPAGHVETGTRLILPRSPSSSASDDWTRFVVIQKHASIEHLNYVFQKG